MRSRFFPWLDRSGRLSILKLVVFVALFVPALWVAVQYDLGWLKTDNVKSLVHEMGLWAIRILLVSLAITPLRRIGQWNKLISVRRMLGVAVLAYGLAHFALYIALEHFDLGLVASEILFRFYLTVGFVTLLGLAVLGTTSTDAMIRRIGGARWNRLHVLVYPIAILALLHYMLQTKLDVSAPLLLVGLFFLEMGWRLLQRFKRGESLVSLAVLAVAAAAATALFEAVWYQFRNGIDAMEVLGADLSFDDGPRPVWFVLLAGLVLVVLRLARPLWAKRPQSARPLAATTR
ncbi:MAG: sulfite oxidase heme-binding subunit YedZ [Janthinobacterium lividum]